MKYFSAFAWVLSVVSAHGGVGVYTMDGVSYDGWQPYNSPDGQKSIQRLYSSFNPLLLADLNSVNLRCNNDGTALGTGLSATVKAGSTILAHWTQWTHRPAAAMVYMAKCPGSCNSWNGAGTVWFKVAHLGLVSGTQRDGKWAGDQLVDTLNYTMTVPASLVPGEYLIRHELLALHQAGNPQLYPECAQLIVTGSGTQSPGPEYLVAFPGAYKSTDPGLTMNIDAASATVETTYQIPGPSVWPGTGHPVSSAAVTSTQAIPTTTLVSSSKPPSSAPVSTSKPASSSAAVSSTRPASTTLVSSTRPASSSTPSPSSCTVAKYGQCGGTGYNGCKTCAAGSTCKMLNTYYYQCL